MSLATEPAFDRTSGASRIAQPIWVSSYPGVELRESGHETGFSLVSTGSLIHR